MTWDDKMQAWALPILVGVLGWLVKDFFFGVLAKRDESARSEWKDMLASLWCPLYYWSGMAMYADGRQGWAGHGLSELEKLLASGAHLIPREHYRTLVHVVEHGAGLEPASPDIAAVRTTRDFIYGKIEALNYLLYRKPVGYDPVGAADLFAGPKTLFRFLSVLMLHVFVWAVIVGSVFAAYLAFARLVYWPSVVFGTVFAGAVVVDWVRRVRLHSELSRRLGPDPSKAPRLRREPGK